MGLYLKDVLKHGKRAGIVIDPSVPAIARDEAAQVLRSHLTALGIDNVRVFMRKRMSNVVLGGEDLKIIDPSRASFAEVGKTSAGTSVELDHDLAACEVKVNVGLVLPNFASVFNGRPESV